MNQANRLIKVTGRDGLLGWIDPSVQPKESPDVQIDLEDGRSLMVPAGFFLKQEDGYYLPISRDQLSTAENDQNQAGRYESLMVVPIIAEQGEMDRPKAATGSVRLHTRVYKHQETIEAQRVREQVEVTHVPVNRPVEKAPGVHFDGDTMVIPVLEEVLVVQKRLVVREEVRVRKTRQTVREPQEVTLRSEQIEVERLGESEKPQED